MSEAGALGHWVGGAGRRTLRSSGPISAAGRTCALNGCARDTRLAGVGREQASPIGGDLLPFDECRLVSVAETGLARRGPPRIAPNQFQ